VEGVLEHGLEVVMLVRLQDVVPTAICRR
jgi:hypothetical protein